MQVVLLGNLVDLWRQNSFPKLGGGAGGLGAVTGVLLNCSWYFCPDQPPWDKQKGIR